MPSPLAAVALALTVASWAADDPSPRSVALTWTPAPGCPDDAELRDDLVHLSQGSVQLATRGHPRGTANMPIAEDTPDEDHARVTATIHPTADGFRLALTVHDGLRQEHRELHAPDCHTLARAAVLLTVVTLGSPVTTARAGPPSTPSPTADAQVPAPVRPRPVITAPEPRSAPPRQSRTYAARSDPPSASPSPRNQAQLSALVGPGLGLNPSPTAILGGELGWTRGALGLDLIGWHAFEAERSVEPGVGVRASLSAGGLRIRSTFEAGPLAIPVALGIEAGVLSGSGAGSRVDASQGRSAWLAGTMGAGIVWPPRSTLALRLSVDGMLTVVRPGIHLRRAATTQEVFRMPPVGVRVLAGPLLRLSRPRPTRNARRRRA